ncbi:hypothetical protein KER29_26645, partial [Escherichia coli]|nr:hypothetical protein [Escherichia coli]
LPSTVNIQKKRLFIFVYHFPIKHRTPVSGLTFCICLARESLRAKMYRYGKMWTTRKIILYFSLHYSSFRATGRWFHDTAYCFDFILIFPMVPGAGLEPAQRERRGILKTINHHL